MGSNNITNRFITGFVSGLVLPVIVFIVVFFVSSAELDFAACLKRITDNNLVTHFISLCVFPNIFLFLLFNRLDKLLSSRGILGITIIWALAAFLIKLL